MFNFCKKFLCFIGYHNWTWKIKEGEVLFLDSSPPSHAFCDKCDKKYKSEV